MRHWQDYCRLMRIDKPIGWLLLLWPTLAALWLASDGHPSAKHIVIFCAGVFVMRAAGCIINDVADRHFDGQVKRTAQRPLANNSLSIPSVMILFAGLLVIALILVLQLNRLSLLLAIGFVGVTVLYPFCKRFTYLPQVILGIPFNGGIPIAFAATSNHVPYVAWEFFMIMILWTVVYDTFYAMVDREDDVKLGLRSSAILFGHYDRPITASLQVIITIGLIFLGMYFRLNAWYYLSLSLIVGFFVYQQYLIRNRQRDACFQAFLNSNWPLFCLFFGIFLNYQA